MSKHNIYWICQVSGWLMFVLLNFLFIQLESALTSEAIVGLAVSFFTGIFTSHLYRNFIIRHGWLKFGFLKLIPRFILSSIVLAIFYYAITYIITSSFINQRLELPDLSSVLAVLFNIAFVYLVWSLIYFLFNFIENYRNEEIKNLKWEASKNEIELNRLKSQLNPHFMFNSMNSIRALIDEDPAKAKNAINQLSNILRTTLQMGKQKLISFDEEMVLVKDYLDLEMTRYEERLKVNYKIDPLSSTYMVPPLMIQTLVENAIKHGISKLMNGGEIEIEAKVDEEYLKIKIINDGKIESGQKEVNTGYGIKNTIQRLNLLYGNKAVFSLRKLNEFKVITELKIPKEYEGTDN